MSQNKYDVNSLYQFLIQTPEQGLRKMLVDNKPFSEVHFNLLMKVVRSCDESKFVSHFEAGDFPKVKFSPAEIKLREGFWNDCVKTLDSRGLLSPASPAKAA
ncbi:MAG: hypothetical protein ACLGGX_10100 [Bdellovibrionia bacterium]